MTNTDTAATAAANPLNALDEFFAKVKSELQIFEGDVIAVCQKIGAGIEVAAEDLQYSLSWLGNHIGEVAQTVTAVQGSVNALNDAGIPIPAALTTGLNALNDAVAGVNMAMNNQTVSTNASAALTDGYKATKALQVAAATAAGLAAAVASATAPPVTQ